MTRSKTLRIALTLMATIALVASLALCACSSGQPVQNQAAQNAEPAKPLDLTGTWKQINSNSEATWHEAVIEDDAITITWIMNNGDSKSLYWAGTYQAPTTADQTYAWTSENDKDQTSRSLFASGDDTKDFSYENGQLSYSASAFGTTMTIRMERV